MKPVSSQIAARFAANLRRCRKQAGLSQEELGYRCLIHRTHIGALERAKLIPRAETLVKLAGGLGVSPGELTRGIAWEPGYVEVVEGGFAVGDPPAGDPDGPLPAGKTAEPRGQRSAL
jgi:transcriptional regulator with XRE-family HTH domain